MMEDNEVSKEIGSINYEKLPLKRLFGWTVLQFTYTFVGAILYILMEECYGTDVISSSTYKAMVDYAEKDTTMSQKEKGIYLNITTQYYENMEKKECSFSHDNLAKWWKFTTVTCYTIGYGHTTPKSDLGKLVTILFASIGIPCSVSMYTCASDLVTRSIRNGVKLIETKCLKRSNIKRLDNKTFLVLAILFIVYFTTVAFFNTLESQGGLSALDSCYFWFQTLTTIGYGDVYPEAAHNDWIEIILRVMQIFGLGITASLISSIATLTKSLGLGKISRRLKRKKKTWNIGNAASETIF